MERITPHLLMRGYALPAMTGALDPHDWPLFPSAKMIVARDAESPEAPGWTGRLREVYAPHLEAALEQARYAALVVDARRALILPFDLAGAELAEEEPGEPDEEEPAIGEVPVEKILHLPDEVRTLPRTAFDPALVEARPTIYGPPIQTVAQRTLRRVLRERYGNVPAGIEFARRFGGALAIPALPDGGAARAHLERTLSLLAIEMPWRFTPWEEALAPLLADPAPLVGENRLLALYRPDRDGDYELVTAVLPADEVRAARPTVYTPGEMLRGVLGGTFDHPSEFADYALSLAPKDRPVRAWVYLAPGDDPHREAKRALLARAGKVGAVLLRAWNVLPDPLNRPVLVALFEGEEDEPLFLFNPREAPVEVRSAPTPEEEVFLRDALA